MRLSVVRMGKEFGNLGVRVRGIISYRLSPYEQRAFAGVFNPGIQNMVRRVREEFFYVVPPFVALYCLISWAKAENLRLKRKNPADYANDE
ncbi:unnamed protein product [Cyprideis torosa]|uniref:Cytochrome b-c1 complex subunit 8 n=1 Tax=Cyprideis torosa TaxID=163714 RepID=A0A7R8W4N4_9CRUS|nr:unnamed protein product [Cyprideis torosa]CAG0884411.1 unnamed protein product [Cyprideis torosa]